MKVLTKIIEPGCKVRCINVAPMRPGDKPPTGIVKGEIYTVRSLDRDSSLDIPVVRLEEVTNSVRESDFASSYPELVDFLLEQHPELDDIGYWIERFIPINDGMEEFMRKLMEPIDFDVDLPEEVRELETVDVR